MLEDLSGAWVGLEGKDHSRSMVPLKTVPYIIKAQTRLEGRDRPNTFFGSVSLY